LSNRIFKANLESLIGISRENLQLIAKKNEDFVKEVIEWDKNEHLVPNDYFNHKHADLANIDWLLLNSIFIASYSYFEYHLYTLARIVEDRIPDNIKIKDLNGKGIYQYRKYLYLIGKLKSAEKDSDWQDLDKFQKTRNKLAHNGGMILTDPTKIKDLKKDELFKFLSKYKVIMAGSLGIIRIRDTEIIEAFDKLTGHISDNMVKEINEKYPD
jgi:hypothetical protein